MRLIKVNALADLIGVSRRTVRQWCHDDPDLAIRRPHPEPAKGFPEFDYYIKIDRLAEKPGLDLVRVLTLESSSWVRAIHYGAIAGWSRRTIVNWCAQKLLSARRVGRIWYIDLDDMGLDQGQIDDIRSRIEAGKATGAIYETLYCRAASSRRRSEKPCSSPSSTAPPSSKTPKQR